jgi:cobalt-zinc-cadmium efflux system protein
VSGDGHTHLSSATAGGRHRKPLLLAFALTAGYMIVEFAAGFAFNSLALLSDAAHMGTDVLGLGMALAAITLAQRPGPSRRTYGAYRLEVLAALANGVLLFAVAGYVLYQAYQRLSEPAGVPGLPLLLVAVIGLIINLISFKLLTAGSKDSINLRGAYLEVLGDLLGSAGVIVAAIIIYTTGWRYADPLIGAGIGLFILPRTFRLTGQALRILMEAAPGRLDVDEIRERIVALQGVLDLHDLHVWTITSGLESASGHVVVEASADYHDVLDRVLALLAEEFHITHSTIQCEPAQHQDSPIAV